MPHQLPSLRALTRRGLPHLFEGTLAPIAIFYAGYAASGLWAGLLAALAWSYGAFLVRLVTRRRVSGLVVLTIVALTARTAIALLTGSAFVYFLQPTLGTFATGAAFLVSAVAGRPLTERLAADIVHLPAAVAEHPAVRRLHVRLTFLWAAVFAVNGAVALWLLLSQPIGLFLVAKSAASVAVMAAAVLASVVAFRRCVGTQAAAA